jgi:hypothetical protein
MFVLTLLEPFWIIIASTSLIGMGTAFRATSRDRKFVPRFQSKRAIALVIIALVGVLMPVVTVFGFLPNYTRTYSLTSDNRADVLEINFTWSNATELSADALGNLTYMDSQPEFEVSIVFPLIYSLNGSYEPYGDGQVCEWNLPIMVYDSFETIEATPIDQIDTLHYVMDGIANDYVETLNASGIAVDFMPLLPKEKYYMYINDLTIDAFNKSYQIAKRFIELNNLTQLFRGLVIDTERDYGDFMNVVSNYWNPNLHESGREKLTQIVQGMKMDQLHWKSNGTVTTWDAQLYQEYVNNKSVHVSCSTFQYHLDDFIDADDEQQHFYEISIIPPFGWDKIGVMTYDKGENSEHNFFGYCRAIDYFFGTNGVPYLYSEDSKENIFNKFRIAQNYGYEFIGLWALTSEICFADWETEGTWCGGLCDRYGWGVLTELTDFLLQDADISFTFSGKDWYKWTYMHLLQLVDLYLIGPPVYATWPLANATRIRFPN